MTSILCWEKWIFNATNSNPIMSKTGNIFSVFLLNSWNLYQVLNISQKKDAADSWLISKIIDCKKHGFLDA